MKQKVNNFITALTVWMLVVGALWGFVLYCENCITGVKDIVYDIKGAIKAKKNKKQIVFDEEPMKVDDSTDDTVQNSEPMTMEELEDLCD